MNRIVYSAMGQLFAAAIAAAAFTPAAHATVYITGSLSDSTSNVPLQSYQSTAASGSLAVDLGRYMRIGVTHKQEFQESDGYKDVSTETGVADTYQQVHSKTHIISNSLDLTLILYEGNVLLPYLTVGGIVKNYRFITVEAGEEPSVKDGTSGLVPNVGMGLGIRLNKDFTLKLSYLASPGQVYNPGDEKVQTVMDRSTSVGLTYQL